LAVLNLLLQGFALSSNRGDQPLRNANMISEIVYH